MPSLFGTLKLEDRTSDFPEGTLITEGDEGESVAAVIAEMTEEEAGVVEAEGEMDRLVDDANTADELVESIEEAPKTEHVGLTPTNALLAARVLKRLGGQTAVKSLMPKMEHYDSRSSRREATSFVLEGLNESLKNFWEALKKQFEKLWNNLKGWYTKSFSAAKKLAERAKQIRDRAESSNATIDKKSFAFGQLKTLAIGGKLKTVSEFEASFNALTTLVADLSEAPTDKAIEALRDDLDKNDTDSGAIAAVNFNNIVTGFVNSFKSVTGNEKIQDPKVLASLGGGVNGDASVSASVTLPGDKQFAVITAKDGGDFNKVARMTRLTLVNTKDKPKEIGSDAEAVTLNSSQVAKLAGQVAESAETIFDYEKKFANVEKSRDAVIKKLDELFREIESAAKDSDSSSERGLRDIRTTASNATALVRRLSGAPAQVNSYAATVFAATLNWCEGSMRNYKQ